MAKKSQEQQPTNTPEGILVRIKNKLCLATGIDTFLLRSLIDKFITTSLQGETSSKTHFAKVNAYNELTASTMTIKVLFKFFRILRVKNVKFTVTITTIKGNEYTATEDVNLFTNENDKPLQ